MLLIILFALEPIQATPALSEPLQDGDFCNRLKVTGTGTFEVGVSVKDRTIALEYSNFMYGDGDLEMDTGTVEAQRATSVPAADNGSSMLLNLWEGSRITYRGETPMIGMKYIHSKAFWGGIGAEITESYSVTEMDREDASTFASTDPTAYTTDPKKLEELLKASQVHMVGISTRNSFNGTWQTDAHMHKMFSKDIKAHEMFNGTFEVEKTITFRESPAAEEKHTGCYGIDC